MTERQMTTTYQMEHSVKITCTRSTHNGKTGIITGIFCAGLSDKEHYLVHIDGDHESTRVFHFFRDEIEPVRSEGIEAIGYW